MLRRLRLAALLLAAPAIAQTSPPGSGPSGYDALDPFIGTGGEGHTYPGAVAPFGMVQLSPDTDTTCTIRDCYPHAAGYRYEDPKSIRDKAIATATANHERATRRLDAVHAEDGVLTLTQQMLSDWFGL